MKKTAFLLLLLASVLTAQTGEKFFNFEYDMTPFRYDSASTRYEFYYSVADTGFVHTYSQKGIFIYPRIDIAIVRTSDSILVMNQPYIVRYAILDTSMTQVFLGKFDIKLQPGKYKMQVAIGDYYDSTKVDYYHTNLDVKKKTPPFISGIELASKLVTGSKKVKSNFYKNSMEVYPNPRAIFYEKMPVVFYYTEIYGLKDYSNPLKFKIELTNSLGKVVWKKESAIHSNKNAVADPGFIQLKNFVSGKYNITAYLIDRSGKSLDKESKDFYYVSSVVADSNYNINDALVKRNFLASPFAILSGPECDAIFKSSKCLASNDEVWQYSQLDSVKQKRVFLYSFWQKRDENPSTPENETYEQFKERVKYADKRFKEYKKRGSLTDRGIIYIKYGEPSKIVRKQNDYYNQPYQTWYYYNIEGGVYFVFGDQNGLGIYRLLHSTKRGERHDPNWMDRLKVR